MPAVQLSRLNNQIADLLLKFSQPSVFREHFHELMEIYADRVLRPSKTSQSLQQISSYHTPQIVLQQIKLALVKPSKDSPEDALTLANTLWEDSYMEAKEVAAFLLGQLPANQSEIVTDQMNKWCQPGESKSILRILLKEGSSELRKEDPETWIRLAKSWLDSPRIEQVNIGLIALQPIINDRSFENLPSVMKMISTLIQQGNLSLHGELSKVIQALAKREPTETAYLIRQILSLGISENTIRLIRKTLPSFPPEIRSSLRTKLKDISLEKKS